MPHRPTHPWLLPRLDRRRAYLLSRLTTETWDMAAPLYSRRVHGSRDVFYADLHALIDNGAIEERRDRPGGPIFVRRRQTLDEQQHEHDRWRARGEPAIRREMERRLSVYLSKKQKKGSHPSCEVLSSRAS